VISSHSRIDDKPLLPLEYLLNLEARELPAPDTREMTREIATAWNPTPNFAKEDLRELLDETLANYKLSATHLNNFIDVSRGGPEHFLMQNLLHFPEAKSPQASFGTAVHEALARAHVFMSANQANKPLEDVLGDFANLLGDADLSERDYNFYLKKGDDALTAFYDQRFKSFATTQRAEYSFASENVVVGGAKLTGKIDLLDVDKTSRSLILTDYKTGKPAISWRGKTDYEKIKLHKYRQQLLFYKLLIENSREFTGWKIAKGVLEFVEPRENGEIAMLEIDYDAPEIAAELAEFCELVAAIWSRILNLDFPDISGFSVDFSGILEFEKALRET
jgi:DNA helicase-2/ATP-dependent DNA helicase PcrA